MGALIRFREGLGKACSVEVPAAQGPGPIPGAGRLREAAHVICAQHAPPHVTLIADPRRLGLASDNAQCCSQAHKRSIEPAPSTLEAGAEGNAMRSLCSGAKQGSYRAAHTNM